jgi:KRAB domain-containing zinc finger protein
MKSFAHKNYLTRHMAVHSGIKPFNCVTCSKSFTQQYYLIVHMATVHGGEK